MEELEQKSFDAIVVGTGLAESILAGALARTGKTVLNIDENEFYGDHFATFDVKGLLRFLLGVAAGTDTGKTATQSNYKDVTVTVYEAPTSALDTISTPLKPAGLDAPVLDQPESDRTPTNEEERILEQQTTTPATPDAGTAARESALFSIRSFFEKHADAIPYLQALCNSQSSVEEFRTGLLATSTDTSLLLRASMACNVIRESRKYNLELSPKVLFCRGPIVELLISSGVGRYLEFKALEGIYLRWEDAFEKVPGSKEDVFANQTVSLLEKRRLMKFLNTAVETEEQNELIKEYDDRPFVDFLSSQNLSPRMSAVIMNAIALVTDEAIAITTSEGLALTKRHVQSLGRWGKTAFLMALYGAGSELTQAFCRLCAVYGGVYMLNYKPQSVAVQQEVADQRPVTLTGSDGKEYSANFLITSGTYAPLLAAACPGLSFKKNFYWRAILIVDGPIHNDSNINITVFPPGKSDVVYCCLQDGDRADLEAAIATFANASATGAAATSKPNIALSVYYKEEVLTPAERWPTPQVAVCDVPPSVLDFEATVGVAKEVFERICPDEEFLPTVPDPEDLAA
ncbi:hypothetical protein HDV00_000806 [Rhizophlyctis rosea]|nr:hypothetical protein HDV00_000806 [Rhizophlyctis rosea]